jgi:glycosyltransferase involved in cell wall biosynthesis
MHILFDHQAFTYQTFGGVTRYYTELMRHLHRDNQVALSLSLCFTNNAYVKELNGFRTKTFLPGKAFRGKYELQSFLNRRVSNKALKAQAFDIFHPTYYYPYFLHFLGNKPFVLTVHDMTHELYLKGCRPGDPTAENKKLLAQKANRIIAVSQNTKRDIVELLGVDESKVDVVYHANSLKLPEEQQYKSFLRKLPQRYILYVGIRKLYKNFTFFLEALSPLLAYDRHLNLVCAGGNDFSREEQDLFENKNVHNQLVYSNVDDGQLALLYRNALCFVFPSIYEGFGIPVLEAWSCDCPAILSNSGSLPEIAADAALYFDPLDPASIRNEIEKILYDNLLRQALITKGRQRLQLFSWEKTALETKRVYERVL